MKKLITLGRNSILLLFCSKDIIFSILNIRYIPLPRVTPSRLSKWIISLCTEPIYGPKEIHFSSNQLVVLCVARNADRIIQQFIEHYFKLGIRHIVFLDNDSEDNTLAIATKYKNITIFKTRLPYKTYTEVFKSYLINQFGKNGWCLCVDIDEFFDYPYSNIISLSSFLDYLNKNSFNAVVAQMLDMFSDKPIASIADKNIISSSKYYDISQIKKGDLRGNNFISNKNIKFHYGGIRRTVFDIDDLYLTKYPLIRLSGKLKAENFRTHFIDRNARLADISCVLYHYKFSSSFLEKCKQAVVEKNYWNNSVQYKKYYSVLRSNPDLNIKKTAIKPQKLKNINDLLDNKFLCVSKNYLNWIKKHKDT